MTFFFLLIQTGGILLSRNIHVIYLDYFHTAIDTFDCLELRYRVSYYLMQESMGILDLPSSRKLILLVKDPFDYIQNVEFIQNSQCKNNSFGKDSSPQFKLSVSCRSIRNMHRGKDKA